MNNSSISDGNTMMELIPSEKDPAACTGAGCGSAKPCHAGLGGGGGEDRGGEQQCSGSQFSHLFRL